jgi:hypothetical protein
MKRLAVLQNTRYCDAPHISLPVTVHGSNPSAFEHAPYMKAVKSAAMTIRRVSCLAKLAIRISRSIGQPGREVHRSLARDAPVWLSFSVGGPKPSPAIVVALVLLSPNGNGYFCDRRAEGTSQRLCPDRPCVRSTNSAEDYFTCRVSM